MRVFLACLDKDQMWVMDDVIGGLYSIDLGSFETKCVIDCFKLYSHGKFEVLSLFVWKENYIVIVPLEVNKSWILYNKITREIEYRKVIEQKCREILIVADSKRNQLYFFPLYKHDPILIVDLDTLACLQMVENWSIRVPCEYSETAWKGTYNGNYLFFPIKSTKILVRMNCESRKVDLLELDIPENMIGVDYAFEELWVLPMNGSRIYQIDENGLIVNTVELMVENSEDSIPDFARIVVQKRYLFLLPYYREGIYVYDKQEGKTQIIPEKSTYLEKNKEVYLRYWEYCVIDNRICFLPYREKYIEIDLDTLAYRIKELFYPDIWSEKEKAWRNIRSHISETDTVIKETDECGLNVFLKYAQYEKNTKSILLHKNVCDRVWDMVKSRGNTT